jgi:general secretion pathway protein D
MRLVWITTLLLAGLAAYGQGTAAPCAVGNTKCLPTANAPSKGDLKKAHKQFERAQKLQRDGKLDEAADAYDRAVELAPQNTEYLSAREMLRQQQVSQHLERGNQFMSAHKTVEALAEFRQALALDPHNEWALQRLQDAAPQPALHTVPEKVSPRLTLVSQSKPTVVTPKQGLQEFHLKGATRNVLEQIATAYGMKLIFDDSVPSKAIKFDIDPVDFFTAFHEAAQIAHVFWVPLTPKQLILYNDTQQLRRENERTVSATFYFTDASTPQELTDVVNLMRTLFDVRFAVPEPTTDSVVVRAPAATIEAAHKVLDTFLSRKPQVLLSIDIFQISHMFTRQLGLNPQTNFQVINVGAAALALLGQGSGNVQDLINQLIASGGINQANSQALQSLLSQLQNQQNSSLGQLANTPFAGFGGGKTFFAIPINGITATASITQSDVKTLQRIDLRTSQGNAATLRIGSRYPILNASFAPVFNSSAITGAIANGSYQAPFPSFSYEDLGITVKATPQVLSNSTVNLKLELQIKALTGQSLNGVPVISNQDYSATTSVLDGSTTAIVGMITQSEQKSISGLPFISIVPGLNYLTASHQKQDEADELLIVITPTILSPAHSRDEGAEVWVPAS